MAALARCAPRSRTLGCARSGARGAALPSSPIRKPPVPGRRWRRWRSARLAHAPSGALAPVLEAPPCPRRPSASRPCLDDDGGVGALRASLTHPRVRSLRCSRRRLALVAHPQAARAGRRWRRWRSARLAHAPSGALAPVLEAPPCPRRPSASRPCLDDDGGVGALRASLTHPRVRSLDPYDSRARRRRTAGRIPPWR